MFIIVVLHYYLFFEHRMCIRKNTYVIRHSLHIRTMCVCFCYASEEHAIIKYKLIHRYGILQCPIWKLLKFVPIKVKKYGIYFPRILIAGFRISYWEEISIGTRIHLIFRGKEKEIGSESRECCGYRLKWVLRQRF